jgi:hypothetical protein
MPVVVLLDTSLSMARQARRLGGGPGEQGDGGQQILQLAVAGIQVAG